MSIRKLYLVTGADLEKIKDTPTLPYNEIYDLIVNTKNETTADVSEEPAVKKIKLTNWLVYNWK